MVLRVHILKERKVTRVMGCALRRQLSVPGAGFSMFSAPNERFVVIQKLLGGRHCVCSHWVVLEQAPIFLEIWQVQGLKSDWLRERDT